MLGIYVVVNQVTLRPKKLVICSLLRMTRVVLFEESEWAKPFKFGVVVSIGQNAKMKKMKESQKVDREISSVMYDWSNVTIHTLHTFLFIQAKCIHMRNFIQIRFLLIFILVFVCETWSVKFIFFRACSWKTARSDKIKNNQASLCLFSFVYLVL